MKIIDCHTHVFSPGLCSDRDKYLTDPGFSLLYSQKKSKVITADELLFAMDEAGIEFSIALGFPWGSKYFLDEQNDYLSHAKILSGGRILPFASVPAADEDDIEEWISALPARGFKGVGEMAFYDRSIADADWIYLDNILTLCGEYSLTAMIHVDEPVGRGYQGKYTTDFARLVKLISAHPDVKIILAHWGGGILFYELMPEIKKTFANVYFDTAASPYLFDDAIYSAAVKIVGSDKILFGSDYPLIKHERYIEPVRRTLSSIEAENILYKNALKLFFE